MKTPDQYLYSITTNEYRPCYITIPHRSSLPTKERGLFHRWTCEQKPVEAGLTRGSHPAGQLSQTWGIVETEDGRIHLVQPERIQFTSTRGMMDQIDWDEEEEAER